MRVVQAVVAWLLAGAGAVLVVQAYRLAAAQEDGSRAGAEPVLAGIVVAAPFLLLALGQVAGAVCVTFAPWRAGRGFGLVLTTVLTVAAVVSFARL